MTATGASKTAVVNARVLDGHRVLAPLTVVIDGDRIGTDPEDARVLDAGGATLLPGMIDAHVHVTSEDDLRRLTDFGVTTGLDMGSWPPTLIESLRGRRGLADLRGAGVPAAAAGGMHARAPGYPQDGIVGTPAEARRFVAARVAEGADYIKVIAETPGQGIDQLTLDALVEAAHANGKLVVAHDVAMSAYAMAQDAGADAITHVPLDHALDRTAVARMADEHRIAVPTLTMMRTILAHSGRSELDYTWARAGVQAMHLAGVPVLAGSDANSAPGVPASVPHGSSLHYELELLVDAGLSTVDALRAATSLPARHFGLDDRGAITPGLRADLVLVEGNPLDDIANTRKIQRVWCAGIEHLTA